MRKENRVVITYLKQLRNGINTSIKKIENCAPEKIESILEEYFVNAETKDIADKMQYVIDNVKIPPKDERF